METNNMMDDFTFKDFKDFMERKERDKRTVERTIAAKPDWKKKYGEMMELGKHLSSEAKRLEALRNKFWADIEIELNEFRDMRYNKDTHEIEILTEEGEPGLIKSPFQI